MSAVLGVLTLLIWLGLVATGFASTGERDTRAAASAPEVWPAVVAVVPARDEADVIERTLGSLLAQDYPGPFRVVLVDDNSADGTGALARTLGDARLSVLTGQPLPAGWTGKLWALSQGIAEADGPRYLWLTDADIEHAPDTLRTLVSIAVAGDRRLVSFMALLHCATPAEHALIPAFVFFFQLLYPFARVNRPGRTAAAAGGCVLVRRDALEAAGGIAAIRGALIDDCALGRLMKREGPVWLGLTRRSRSIRPYHGWRPIGAMIARSGLCPARLFAPQAGGTVAGLALVYFTPPALALFGGGPARIAGGLAWLAMAAAFQPMLRFYGRSPLWGVALPAIAAFYAGCTLASGWQHHRGRGGMWKGRAQALARS